MHPTPKPLHLIPGAQSSGEPFIIDLTTQPHLFISYTEEHQLTELLDSFIQQLTDPSLHNPVFALAINHNRESLLPLVNRDTLFRLFATNNTHGSNTDTPHMFMKALVTEMQRRLNAVNKKKESTFQPLIFIADDILHLAISGSSRYTGTWFLRLLLTGPQVGIHCIVASGSSFRNILKQLKQVHPSTQKLAAKAGIEVTLNSSLGAELVLTGEGLVFYRKAGDGGFVKLYPMYEVRALSFTEI